MNDNETANELALMRNHAAETLFQYLQHGDDDHKAWLKQAIYAFFQGKDRPEIQTEQTIGG